MSGPLIKAKIFNGQGTRVLQLGKATVTIGSGANCDIVLDHESVHNEHARAWLDAGKVWVQDLGGKSGTTLNEAVLPKMKPTLVRQLDILKFGTFEATLGLEPILVRSPMINRSSAPVKAKSPVISAPPPAPAQVEVALPDSAEIESIARVLADVRLQLQMAKLEVKSTKELSTQVQVLSDELKAAQELNQKFSDASKQIDSERESTRREQEGEIRDLLARIQKEKCEAQESFAKRMRDISSELSKRWSGRSFSRDMVKEWEAETFRNFRDVVMHGLDEVPPLPLLPELPIVPDVVVRTLPRSGEEPTVIGDTQASHSESKKRRRPWAKVVLAVVGLAAVLAGLWFGVEKYKTLEAANLSSHAADISTSGKRAAPAHFEPKKGQSYRNSYAENVLYLENFAGAEQNPDFRKLWIQELIKTAQADWKIEESTILLVSVKEEVLIQDLTRIASGITVDREQAGIAQMHVREAQFRKELEDIFKNRAGIDRFLQFKRSFYTRYQAYLHKGSN